MNEKIEPMSPVKVPVSTRVSLGLLTIALKVIWGALVFAAVHVFVYYLYSVYSNGFFDPESLRYGAMVAVGAYFCVIIDKHKIEAMLDVKKVNRNLPFISTEGIEGQEHNQQQKKWR